MLLLILIILLILAAGGGFYGGYGGRNWGYYGWSPFGLLLIILLFLWLVGAFR